MVVDNGSTDNSVQQLKREFRDIVCIENKENLGFAGGNNVGMRYAMEKGADYILLLNNDVIVAPPFLDTLIQVGEKEKDIGILGPKIYCYPETTKLWQWGLGGDIHWKKGITRDRGYRAIRKKEWNARLEVDYVTGCALLVKRAVIERIGGLDERYYLYYEELDFCIRAGRAGFRVLFVPDSVIWHKSGASAGGYDAPVQIYYKTRNRLLFMQRHAEKRDWRRFLLYFWCEGMCKRGIMLVLSGRGTQRNLKALWSGWRDFRRGRFYRGPEWLHQP
jgi:GT2 family glycosyltransferase